MTVLKAFMVAVAERETARRMSDVGCREAGSGKRETGVSGRPATGSHATNVAIVVKPLQYNGLDIHI